MIAPLATRFDEEDDEESGDDDDDYGATTTEFGQTQHQRFSFSASGNSKENDNDDDGELASVLSEDENSVILSICLAQGKLGGAYYDQQTETVRILQDIGEEATDLRLVRSLIGQVQPSCVLANCRQDDKLLLELKTLCSWDRAIQFEEQNSIDDDDEVDNVRYDDNHSSDVQLPFLHLMPNSAFNFSDAKVRLERLLGDSGQNESENRLRMAFQLNLDCVCMIRSFGALLRYMDAKRIGVEFEDNNVKTPITKIQTFTVEEMVEIDENTFAALQIFRLEYHPSVYKAGRAGSYKEGLSLLGICNRCRSTPGRAEIRRWFQRPIVNRDVLRRRQEAVSYFLHDCNQDLSWSIQRSLRNVKNISAILRRMRTSQTSIGDWQTLYKTVYYVMFISSLLKSREAPCALIGEICENFHEDLTQTAILLNELVDFEQMVEENRFVVKRGIDAELDQKKQLYQELPAYLTATAKREFEIYKEWIPECSVIYLPMLGYLLAVPKDPGMSDFDQIPDLEFVFVSSQTVYYKNDNMRALDEELGDLKLQIIDSETSMMLRLQQIIVERTSALVRAVGNAAQLDCLIALALAAHEHGWTRPELVDEPIIDVEGGRHPLVQMCNSSFVPNPIKSGMEYAKVKILTGPNASGKSIYLKQVGLVVFLAHVGSFVPASKARIGPVDRIFSRVHTLDSVLDGLSTFARDMQQIAVALRRASGNSLVIVDEFGKGTMTEVGLSLLTSSLEFWIEKGESACPHLIVSSHLHALLTLLPKSPLLNFQTMEVTRTGSELKFLYKLVDGTIDCSYAAYTALEAGLSDTIVERGYEIYNCLKAGETISTSMSGQEDQSALLTDLGHKFFTYDLVNDTEGFIALAVALLPDKNYDQQQEDYRLHTPSPSPKSPDVDRLHTSYQSPKSPEEDRLHTPYQSPSTSTSHSLLRSKTLSGGRLSKSNDSDCGDDQPSRNNDDLLSDG